MKNKVKLTGIIALIAVICLFIAGCGKISSDLEGTWVKDGDSGWTLKIASDEFSYVAGDGMASVKAADNVTKSGNKLRLKKGSNDVGEITYKLDGSKLELSDGKDAVKIANGKYTKK